MDDEKSWIRESWRTGVVLALLLGLAFFLRTYFTWNLFYPAGFFSFKGDYSGGSDPFYWEKAMFYTLQSGKEIAWDRAMNYPIGFPDVRPPLFAWFNVLTGYMLSPLIGNARDASVLMLNLNAAIFGTLTIIPTYLLGREAFGRRVGIISALLLAISAAALQRSHATIGVHDAWTLFFVACAFYFYLRALKTLQRSRWVENWFQRASIAKGLRTFFRENRSSVLYSLLAGMSVAVTALSWQGWAYVPVMLVLVYVVEIILDRIRNQDVMGITILFTLIFATPLLVSFPWYYVRGLIHVWWDVPFYLFAVALVLGIAFSVTRDYPWTLVIPATFVAGGIGLVIGFAVNPALLFAFVSGAGYFIKTKVYQTIAEAQEPGMSELVLSFGWFTFYLGLGATAIMIWQTPRRNNPAFTMLVFWTLGSLFMALSAARFIFNAAGPFAVATAYAIDLILVRMDFAGMRRTYRSLAEGSRRNALRKSIKMRHVLTILFVAFLILLPNTWFAVDAGIPFELKGTYDKQVQALLPSFLQAPGYGSSQSSSFYFGAFGYSLPTATDYFPAAYHWLDGQDTGVYLDDRPSVMAWWDYGFEIAERGGHPVVADPFQNGYAIAGQFLLSQNESAAISLMIIRLVEGDWRSHYPNLGPAVSDTLNRFGLSAEEIRNVFLHPQNVIPTILANPNTYGPWDSNMQTSNAAYIFLSQLLLQRLGIERLVDLYRSMRQATGWDIGYFMVDTRLFPISASNTGIFYAPAKLSDHRVTNLISGQVMPQDFFQIFADTSVGTHLPVQILSPADQITSESIEYQPMFYNSTFYRAYIGYSPYDLGSNDKGIPGFSQTLSSVSPIPAWNMTHFRVVYRTSYYNPYTDVSNHTGAWQAVSFTDAVQLQNDISAGRITGTVDLSTQASVTNGAVILRYYDGAWVNGTVTVAGAPLANVFVTASDELGTPHNLTRTDAKGHYSALVPFGNITLTVSTGNLTKRTLTGSATLASTTFPVTLDQALRVDTDLNGDGVLDWLMTKDFSIPSVAVRGFVYSDINKDSARGPEDLPLAGATVTLSTSQPSYVVNVTTDSTGAYVAPALLPGQYKITIRYRGHTISATPLTVGTTTTTGDISAPFITVQGNAILSDGSPVVGALVTLLDATNGSAWTTTAASSGAFVFQPILSGDYTLTAVSGSFASLPQPFTANAATQSMNLTLAPSGWVAGTTYVLGTPQAFASLQFQSASTTSLVRTVRSDADGRFNVTLPAGTWNVNGRLYQGPDLYATLARVTVRDGRTTDLAAVFTEGARLNGTVSSFGLTPDVRAPVGFLSPEGDWWVRSGSDNAYVTYLPLSTYSVQASMGNLAYAGKVELSRNQILNLPLSNGTSQSGVIYWDMNGNGQLNTGEGIREARVVLADNLGQELLAVTNSTGGFAFVGFSDQTYAGTVSADGFASTTLGPTTLSGFGPSVQVALSPLLVSVSGSVLVNGTPLLNHPVAIHAVAIDTSARSVNRTSISDGTYSLLLVPGRYKFVVDENVSANSDAWRYQNLSSDSVLFRVAEGLASYDLRLGARALVKGNVTLNGVAEAASVSFTGPDVRNVTVTSSGFKVYLLPGSYSVSASRAVGDVQYAVLRNATVPFSGNLTLVLVRATEVSGQLLFNGASVTFPTVVSFVRSEGGSFQVTGSPTGGYTAHLVTGNYTVSVDVTNATESGSFLRYYRYTFTDSLAVAGGTASMSFDLHLARTLDNATVSGFVTLGGTGVDAAVDLIALGGGALNASLTVPANGAYSVSLAPGIYQVYATRALGDGAFLRLLTVPHVPSLAYDVPLARGYVLSGVTTDDTGARTTARMQIASADLRLDVASDGSGAYRLLLPSDNYTITASRGAIRQGVSIDYNATASIDLTADSVVNLQLAKVVHRAVGLFWDASQNRTIIPGGTVTYTFGVQNEGNVQDTYTFSGSASGWTFSFSPAQADLDFGSAGNRTYVRVTIQAPEDALVSHGPVTVRATSTEDSSAQGSLDLTVGIVRVRSISVSLDPASGTYDGRFLNYTVLVRNSGNDEETVSVMLTNPGDLAASGWIARVGKPGEAATGPVYADVSVPADGTTQVRLSLQQSGGASGATVVLRVQAQDDPSVSAQVIATANLPSLQSAAGIGVSGPQVLRTLPLNSQVLAILVGVVGAVAVALVLTRRRR